MKSKDYVIKKRYRDIYLIIGMIFLTVVIALVFFFTRKDGAYVLIIKDGIQTDSYSLKEDRTVSITEGDTVTNVLIIKNGEAYISEAICPDKICVEHSAISKVGEMIVCLPEKLIIKISEFNEEAPDMVV